MLPWRSRLRWGRSRGCPRLRGPSVQLRLTHWRRWVGRHPLLRARGWALRGPLGAGTRGEGRPAPAGWCGSGSTGEREGEALSAVALVHGGEVANPPLGGARGGGDEGGAAPGHGASPCLGTCRQGPVLDPTALECRHRRFDGGGDALLAKGDRASAHRCSTSDASATGSVSGLGGHGEAREVQEGGSLLVARD